MFRKKDWRLKKKSFPGKQAQSWRFEFRKFPGACPQDETFMGEGSEGGKIAQ